MYVRMTEEWSVGKVCLPTVHGSIGELEVIKLFPHENNSLYSTQYLHGELDELHEFLEF